MLPSSGQRGLCKMINGAAPFRLAESSPKRESSPEASNFPKKPRLFAESYEEKLERRQQNRRGLGGRNNITSCRSLPRQQRTTEQSHRQEQFLKRRNLTVGKEETKPKMPSEPTPPCVGNREVATERQDVGPDPAKQKPTAAVQTSLQNGSLFSHTSFHWGQKVEWAFPSDAPPQKNTVNLKTSDSGKATEVPSDVGVEINRPTSKEASQQTECGVTILDKEIQQLSEYLKEALHRELQLKQKLRFLQQLLSTVLQASEKSWKIQFDDDVTQSKLQALEQQLYACTQNYSRDGAKRCVVEMEEQKLKYQLVAKESLRKAIEQRIAAEQSLASVQRSLSAAEQDCAHWRQSYNMAMADNVELTARHSETVDQLHNLQSRLQGAEGRVLTMESLQEKLKVAENEKLEFQEQVSVLQEQNDRKQEQLMTIEVHLQRTEEQRLAMESTICELQDVVSSPLHQQQQQELQQAIRDLVDQLQRQTDLLRSKEKQCTEHQLELRVLQDEHRRCAKMPRQPREELKRLQKKSAKRRCCRWISLLMLTMVAVFFAVIYADLDILLS
uniref:TRAF3-interacting JNK-activating modulator n=1 Tax=Callorhinchus milii TaxID=7868 RepID=A0A4W3GNF0_CALMI|eukprot:gi/632963209/ref/XP_007897753.1/ PREDICTED: TRAF3-interacting JNK-activating modulator isoform X1 [Callorhinchus milii]